MSKSLDFIISKDESYYKQKLYDFRLRKNGLVFSYTENYIYLFNVLAYNAIKSYTLGDVYIENINDKIFVEFMTKYAENKYITLEDIKNILCSNKCDLDITESKDKEWDFISYSKWIVIK
jgi:hypothetical protein